MEIFINNIQDYNKKEQTIIIRDRGISLIDGNSCYEKILCKDVDFICDIKHELTKIMFEWKDEYVGNRKIDGEKYHITVDINHKKKKYKIQNKFPGNWERFLQLKQRIMEVDTDE